MSKPLILVLYGVALYFSTKKWYDAGNKGLPEPTTITGATYLYALLLLSTGFVPVGIPVTLAVASVFMLYNQSQKKPVKNQAPAGVQGPVVPGKVQDKIG